MAPRLKPTKQVTAMSARETWRQWVMMVGNSPSSRATGEISPTASPEAVLVVKLTT